MHSCSVRNPPTRVVFQDLGLMLSGVWQNNVVTLLSYISSYRKKFVKKRISRTGRFSVFHEAPFLYQLFHRNIPENRMSGQQNKYVFILVHKHDLGLIIYSYYYYYYYYYYITRKQSICWTYVSFNTEHKKVIVCQPGKSRQTEIF